MKKLHSLCLKDFFLNPWALICFLAFYAAIGAAWLYLGNFWETGENSLFGMFAFMPWILAVFIPCLLMGLWPEIPDNETKCHHFLPAFLFISIALLASFPIWLAVNFTGSIDNPVILLSYLATIVLSSAFIGIAIFCAAISKNQILNLILAITLGIIFAYASGRYFMPLIQGVVLPSSVVYFVAAPAFIFFASYVRREQKKSFKKAIEIICTATIFISFVVIANPIDNYYFFDLTKNNLYSLSKSSKQAVKKLKAPVTIELKAAPEFAVYTNALKKVLQSYVRAAEGNIKIKEYPAVGNEKISLFITDDTDRQKDIPLLEGYGNRALENVITSAILEVSANENKTIGIISSLPIDGREASFNPAQNIPRWEVMKQIRERFSVYPIALSADKIPEEVDVLMIVNPKKIPESLKKAIDAFILTKGRMLVFLDPLPEAEKAYPEAVQSGKMNADDWFTNLGFKFYHDRIVANPKNARKVLKDGKLTDYIIRLCIPRKDLNTNDELMKYIEQINITSSGYFDIFPKDNLVISPLFSSGTDSGIFSLAEVLEGNDPQTLADKYKPDGNDYILALRITGTPESIYQPGEKASQPVDILVFADSDILYDQFWILPKEGAFADNGDLVLNALENLSEAPSLAALRAKQKQPPDLIMIKDIVSRRNISLLALLPLPLAVLFGWGGFLLVRRYRHVRK